MLELSVLALFAVLFNVGFTWRADSHILRAVFQFPEAGVQIGVHLLPQGGGFFGIGGAGFRFLCPLLGFGGAAQGGIFVFVGGAVAFLGTGGGGLQLAVLLMQAVNIGQGGIAGGFGGGCGIEGVHPVGAQLLVFF